MLDTSEILLAGYKHWRDIGNDLLIGGLIIEVFISAVVSDKRKYKWLPELLAAVLVLVGVWVEVQNGGRADEIERQIRRVSSEKIAGLNRQAKQLSNDEAQAHRDIAAANTRVAEAEARTAEANLKTEQLHAEIQPRDLTPDQQQQIADACKAFAGRTVIMGSYALDVESMRLAIEIASALNAGGLHVVNGTGSLVIMGSNLSLGIHFWSPDNDRDLINAVVQALASKGKLIVAPASMPPPMMRRLSDAFVFVGPKPIPKMRLLGPRRP